MSRKEPPPTANHQSYTERSYNVSLFWGEISMCLLKKSINLLKLFDFLHALLPLQSGASLLFSITSLIDRLFFRVPVSLLPNVLLKTSIFCKIQIYILKNFFYYYIFLSRRSEFVISPSFIQFSFMSYYSPL